MALYINTNVSAIDAANNLGTTERALEKSTQQLSSGLRINTAADDAAGLTISQSLSSQVTGANQANRNAQDGVSLVQTASGALTQVQQMLQRIRELAVQYGNGTLNSTDQTAIQTEVNQLLSEIEQIGTTTAFNATHLLNATASVTLQIGANDGETITVATVSLGGLISSITGGGSSGGGGSGGGNDQLIGPGGETVHAVGLASESSLAQGTWVYFDNTTPGNGSDAGPYVESAGDSSGPASFANVTQVELFSTYSGPDSAGYNPEPQDGSTFAVQVGGPMTTAQIYDGWTTTWSQVPANEQWTLQAGPSSGPASGGGSAFSLGSATTLSAIDAAIRAVSGAASTFGAVQNRLQYTVANLSISSENLTAANSRITDVDMASAMTAFTSQQVLQQAGTAMLTQAQKLPDAVLSLLQGA